MTKLEEQRCENCCFSGADTSLALSSDKSYVCRLYPPIKYRDYSFGWLFVVSIIIFFFGIGIATSGFENLSARHSQVIMGWILIGVSGLILQAGYFMLIRRSNRVESSDWCGQWKAKPAPDKTAWELTVEGRQERSEAESVPDEAERSSKIDPIPIILIVVLLIIVILNYRTLTAVRQDIKSELKALRRQIGKED